MKQITNLESKSTQLTTADIRLFPKIGNRKAARKLIFDNL